MSYRLDGGRAGVRFMVLARTFSPEYTPSVGPTQPLPLWVPVALPPEVEAYYSSACNSEVKNTWSYTSSPPYAFMA